MRLSHKFQKVGSFFTYKYFQQVMVSGPARAAKNLRKQGVPFDLAHIMILGQEPRQWTTGEEQ